MDDAKAETELQQKSAQVPFGFIRVRRWDKLVKGILGIHDDARISDVAVNVNALPVCDEISEAYAETVSEDRFFGVELSPTRIDFCSGQHPVPAKRNAEKACVRKRNQVFGNGDAIFEVKRKSLERVAVIVNFISAVRDDDGFIVVDESESEAHEMILAPLQLKARGHGKAKVHLLKILLGDVAAFGFGQCRCAKILVDRIDFGLKDVAAVKSDKGNGRLNEK